MDVGSIACMDVGCSAHTHAVIWSVCLLTTGSALVLDIQNLLALQIYVLGMHPSAWRRHVGVSHCSEVHGATNQNHWCTVCCTARRVEPPCRVFRPGTISAASVTLACRLCSLSCGPTSVAAVACRSGSGVRNCGTQLYMMAHAAFHILPPSPVSAFLPRHLCPFASVACRCGPGAGMRAERWGTGTAATRTSPSASRRCRVSGLSR